MNHFTMPAVLLVHVLLFLPNSVAAETAQGQCFCIKARPGETPPYYIARFTPSPSGCGNRSYTTNGKSPAANGLRSCGAAAGAAGAKPGQEGELSRNRVYGYAKSDDGEGLKKYLAPFFEKGEVPDMSLVFGIKGGFRSSSQRNGPTTGVSSILASKDVGGRVLFTEVFGLVCVGSEWFTNTVARRDGLSPYWGGAVFLKKELSCRLPRFPDGETDEIQVRKYGKNLVTRQIRRSAGGTLVEYGFYYLNLGRF